MVEIKQPGKVVFTDGQFAQCAALNENPGYCSQTVRSSKSKSLWLQTLIICYSFVSCCFLRQNLEPFWLLSWSHSCRHCMREILLREFAIDRFTCSIIMFTANSKQQKWPRDHVYPSFTTCCFQFLSKIEYFYISIKGQNHFALFSSTW